MSVSLSRCRGGGVWKCENTAGLNLAVSQSCRRQVKAWPAVGRSPHVSGQGSWQFNKTRSGSRLAGFDMLYEVCICNLYEVFRTCKLPGAVLRCHLPRFQVVSASISVTFICRPFFIRLLTTCNYQLRMPRKRLRYLIILFPMIMSDTTSEYCLRPVVQNLQEFPSTSTNGCHAHHLKYGRVPCTNAECCRLSPKWPTLVQSLLSGALSSM